MILVTGATGILGSYIVEELQRRGQAVRVLARLQSKYLARQKGVEVCLGDLADLDSMHRATQGVTGIIHAACTLEDHSLDDRSVYGIGKIRCEELLAEHAQQTRRTEFSILRPPTSGHVICAVSTIAHRRQPKCMPGYVVAHLSCCLGEYRMGGRAVATIGSMRVS